MAVHMLLSGRPGFFIVARVSMLWSTHRHVPYRVLRHVSSAHAQTKCGAVCTIAMP